MEINDLVQRGFDDLVAFANDEQGDDLTTSSDLKENNSWERVGEKYGVTIFKKNNGMAIKCCKGVGIIENVTPKMIFDTINDPERAQEWDKMLVESRLVKKLEHDKIAIIYVSTRGQFPISPRDFCLAVSHRIEPDGTYLQLSRSVVDSSVPLVPGKVRAELLTSGFIIKPIVQVNGVTKYSCKVTYVVQFDPKGLIPSFLANMIAEYQPLRIAKIRSIMRRMNASIPIAPVVELKEGKQEESEVISSKEETKEVKELYVNNVKTGKRLIEDEDEVSDSESEAFEDPINDFSNVGDDMKACLSTLQNEVSSLQTNLQRAQAQIYLMQSSISDSGKVVGLEGVSNRPTSSNLLPIYFSRLKQMIEQQKLDINVQRKREELNQKRIENMALRLDFLEQSTSARIYLANWRGKLIFLCALFIWPLISFKIWNFIRKRTLIQKLIEKLFKYLPLFLGTKS